jgi:HSP20 family molecular chaperone IbpA
MFFATTNPAFQGRSAIRPTNRSLERFMTSALQGIHAKACTVAQDDTSYTLSFDVPGVSREHLMIGFEGSVVRI